MCRCSLPSRLLAKGYKIDMGGRGRHDAAPLLGRRVRGSGARSAHALGGWRLALLAGLGFLYIALFRQWDSAMLTLALILVCVPICVVTGLLVGIWGYL